MASNPFTYFQHLYMKNPNVDFVKSYGVSETIYKAIVKRVSSFNKISYIDRGKEYAYLIKQAQAVWSKMTKEHKRRVKEQFKHDNELTSAFNKKSNTDLLKDTNLQKIKNEQDIYFIKCCINMFDSFIRQGIPSNMLDLLQNDMIVNKILLFSIKDNLSLDVFIKRIEVFSNYNIDYDVIMSNLVLYNKTAHAKYCLDNELCEVKLNLIQDAIDLNYLEMTKLLVQHYDNENILNIVVRIEDLSTPSIESDNSNCSDYIKDYIVKYKFMHPVTPTLAVFKQISTFDQTFEFDINAIESDYIKSQISFNNGDISKVSFPSDIINKSIFNFIYKICVECYNKTPEEIKQILSEYGVKKNTPAYEAIDFLGIRRILNTWNSKNSECYK